MTTQFSTHTDLTIHTNHTNHTNYTNLINSPDQMKISNIYITVLFLAFTNLLSAQEIEKKADSGFQFTIMKQVGATPVKNQYRSGTCWSYSAISFFESELLRMGKDTFNLSEMFCVRNSYSGKAIMYIRFQGKHNFGSGGEFHDVSDVFRKYGMIPEEFYNGNTIGEVNPVHGEVDGVLSAYIEAVQKNPNRKLTPIWHQGFDGILDAYLGKVPEKFTYKGKDYSTKSFAGSLGLNMDDYMEISSFTHHPFYTKFIIEIPDNWALGEVYNLPMDEMIRVIDNSLENGYSVAWGSDISEKVFPGKMVLHLCRIKTLPKLQVWKGQNGRRCQMRIRRNSCLNLISLFLRKPSPRKCAR